MNWTGSTAAELVPQLRGAIIEGELPPGSPIALAEFSERWDVPMVVVRDALLRLQAQRLVVRSPGGEFAVTDATPAGLDALTGLRQLIEAEAVRASVRNHASDWADRVAATHEALEAAERATDHPALDETWLTAHAQFHEALCSGAENPRLVSLARELREEAEIYRELAAMALSGGGAAAHHDPPLVSATAGGGRPGARCGREPAYRAEAVADRSDTTGYCAFDRCRGPLSLRPLRAHPRGCRPGAASG